MEIGVFPKDFLPHLFQSRPQVRLGQVRLPGFGVSCGGIRVLTSVISRAAAAAARFPINNVMRCTTTPATARDSRRMKKAPPFQTQTQLDPTIPSHPTSLMTQQCASHKKPITRAGTGTAKHNTRTTNLPTYLPTYPSSLKVFRLTGSDIFVFCTFSSLFVMHACMLRATCRDTPYADRQTLCFQPRTKNRFNRTCLCLCLCLYLAARMYVFAAQSRRSSVVILVFFLTLLLLYVCAIIVFAVCVCIYVVRHTIMRLDFITRAHLFCLLCRDVL